MSMCLAGHSNKFKVLVTGGAGFLGSHIVDLFIEKAIDTSVLKSGFRSNNHINIVNPNAQVIAGDLLDFFSLLKATKDVDVVLHCGGVLSHWAEHYPEMAFDVNVKGTWNLKRACHMNGVKRIVFASTSFVYGDPEKIPITEEAPCNPKGNFEVGKLAAEKILQATFPFHVPCTILRLFNMYGPRSFPDEHYSQAITTFILRALAKESIEIHADGEQALDFVYVKDVAEAFFNSLRPCATDQIFNIGSGKSVPVIELANLINIVTKNPAKLHYNLNHPPYLQHIKADIHKANEILDWKPTTSLVEGLDMTAQYFKSWRAKQ